jgi:predicted NUDIX family NTP pyrophosphohydrolase
MYRRRAGEIEVLLVHPGGPFWTRRDLGAWTIPKGGFEPPEQPLDAAKREFREETGWTASGEMTPLTPLKQPSGKIVHAWAFEGDCDPTTLRSEPFAMEWPPNSGKQAEFPEIDRAGWFELEEAARRILRGQAGFLQELEEILRRQGHRPAVH